MKYTISAIAIACLGTVTWAYLSGGLEFALIMAGALIAISICGILPVLFAARSRHRENAPRGPGADTERITVKEDDPESRTLP